MDMSELAVAEREFLQAKRTLSFHERRDHNISIEYYNTLRENIERTQARFEAALDNHIIEKQRMDNR